MQEVCVWRCLGWGWEGVLATAWLMLRACCRHCVFWCCYCSALPDLCPIAYAYCCLRQCLGYLSESLETCEIAPEPADQNGRALFERLQILDLAEQLSRRVLDLKKNLSGAHHELSVRVGGVGALGKRERGRMVYAVVGM